jgi:hypothetical protein
MRERVYSGSFEVHATSVDEAVSTAIDEFNQIAKLSSVGWVRAITRVTCSWGSGDAIEVFSDSGAYGEPSSDRGTDRPTEPSGLFWRRPKRVVTAK